MIAQNSSCKTQVCFFSIVVYNNQTMVRNQGFQPTALFQGGAAEKGEPPPPPLFTQSIAENARLIGKIAPISQLRSAFKGEIQSKVDSNSI
jgi:hypothetical protein